MSLFKNSLKFMSRNPMQAYLATMAIGQWKLWTTGVDGGYAGTAVTASISGTVLTVTVAAYNTIFEGQFVTGGTTAADTRIVGQLTGTPGGVGTYTVTVSQTAASGSKTIGAGLPRTRANFDGNGTGAGGTWNSDAEVVAGAGSGTPGIGTTGANWPYTTAAINPFNGDVIHRASGHTNSGDGSIYGLNIFSGPGVSWQMKVASAKYIPMSEAKPAWSNQTVSGLTYSRTATGLAGQNQITIDSATSIVGTTVMRVFAAGGGIPAGTRMTAISGTLVTLSNNLTADLSASAVVFSRSHWGVENRNGVQMPISAHNYWYNTFAPNSDILYLSSGGGWDPNAGTNMGSGWAYKPSNGGVNDNMLGPFYRPANFPSSPSTAYGYVNSPGGIAANDLDGCLYIYTVDPGNVGRFYRISTPDTNPVATLVGAGGGVNGNTGTNAVIFPDPVNGPTKRAYFSLRPDLLSNFRLWTDIGNTPFYAAGTFDFALPTLASYASFCWNADNNVMALTDGIDIWEFAIDATRHAGAFTKITTGATGDLPGAAVAAMMARMVYLPAPYRCYVLTHNTQVRVLRRA
jgi:hypothetical protein